MQLTPRVVKRGSQQDLCCQKYCIMCQCANSVVKCPESLAVVKTKIELDWHADSCVISGQCLVIHDHNRPVNVFGYDPRVGSKHACKLVATSAYDEHEMGQVVICLVNQAIKIKGLYHHLFCPMQCSINVVLINELLSFWHPFPVRPCMPYRLRTLLMPPTQ